MRFNFKGWAYIAIAMLGFATTIEILVPAAPAQTLVTAQLSGVVTDSTGAIVRNAVVTIVSTDTGETRVLATNTEGRYVSPFMPPGMVTVSASAPGLQSNTISVQLLVGQQSVANLTISPTGSKQTVTVSANNVQLIDTQSANLITTFTTKQFQNLPMPGMDITTIAFTVPGVVLKGAGGGSGNFVSNGIPGNANLFVINGADDMDQTDTVNNSGATNLALGSLEIAQASVVQNGYSVQYGRVAGAIVTYTTKSGTNQFHGLAQYNYNSDGLNANSFFNNLTGTPKTKAVANQYAAQFGGPILKNKLFGFSDYEGIRFVLPSVNFVNFPSAQLQNTILNTVSTQGATLYGQMFKLLQTAPSYATAQPVTNGSGVLQDANNLLGCGSLAGTPVFGQPNTYFGAVPKGATGPAIAIPCVNAVRAAVGSLTTEWRLATRVDYTISDRQSVFFRFMFDRSVVSFPSLVNPVLDATSPQPIDTAQLNHTYVFTPNVTNQFLIAFNKSRSNQFPAASTPDLLAASPTALFEANDGGTNSQAGFGQAGLMGFNYTSYPVGEMQSEYQAVDDLSWLKGNHNFKMGFSFLRGNFTNNQAQQGTIAGEYEFGDAADFAGGTLPGSASSSFNQSFDHVGLPHEATYSLGVYAQDEWKATPNLVVDFGLRVDRNGNPLCNEYCFTSYRGGVFPASGVSLSTPYNATIITGLPHPFASVQKAVVQPRAGFNWDMTGQGKTVARGGVGLFAQQLEQDFIFPAFFVFPNVYSPQVLSGIVGQGAGSAQVAAEASDTAVSTGFSQGQNINQIAASLPVGVKFTPPTYFFAPQNFVYPSFLEWSLQIQRQLTRTDAVILSYAGNHGQHLALENGHLNQSLGASPYFPATKYTSFGGLPLASPDPRFGQVTTFTSGAVSNYNGVSLVYKHISHNGITANLAYTWSHSLDDVSSDGLTGAANAQITPYSASALMYSNSVYDVRHNFVMDFAYVEPNRFANKLVQLVAGGWTVASKAYWRTGEPFSVTNNKAQTALTNGTGAVRVLAQVLNNNFNHSCNSYSNPCFQTPGIFNGSASQNIFGNVPRNAFFGPHYADVDLNVFKDLVQVKQMQFQVGAQAYNVLNHVNFGSPQSNSSNTGTLGRFSSEVSPPTSPYGHGFGGSQGRVVVVQGRLIF